MFIRQSQPFLKRFSEQNVSQGFRENGREKVLKPQDHTFQQAETT